MGNQMIPVLTSAILEKVGAHLDHQTPHGGLPGGGVILAEIHSRN